MLVVGGISVLVVDDDATVRDGICRLLETLAQPEVTRIDVAGDGEEALLRAAATRPDLVLMDLGMPRLDGVEAIRELHRSDPELPVLALTTFSAEETVLAAMAAGASGYLVKDRAAQELGPAVRAVLEDGMPLSPEAARALTTWVAQRLQDEEAGRQVASPAPMDPMWESLSERESECVDHLARGMSNQEIADAMFVSLGAIKSYLASCCRKLGVRDRVQLLIRSTELGLVQPQLPRDHLG